MSKPKEIRQEIPVELYPALEKTFTIRRVKQGWVFVAITLKDGNIVDIDRSEPDLKAVAIEKFKIASFKYWSSIG